MDAKTELASIESDAADRGIRMAAVCRKAGMSQSLVSRWRHGLHEPRLSNLARLRGALDELIAASTLKVARKTGEDDSLDSLL